MSMSVGVVSLGCTKNTVDTEQMLGLLTAEGYTITKSPQEADILIVNTCGFIESAKEESIEAILEMAAYKQRGRCQLLVVTGCLAQRYSEALLSEMPEIDLLMGVNQYGSLPAAIREALGGERPAYCAPSPAFYEGTRVLTTPGYSAYIKTGDGCDNRCAYCAIPLIRGGYRSRPMADILAEVRSLAARGVKEHILIAQDTSRYGTDWQAESLLPELMAEAAAIPGVEWLRVLYCYPETTTLRLLDTIAGRDNICNYLDLPIQHINGDILRAMNRRGTPEEITATLRAARQRGLTLRTSIIVGFPGETEAQFQELLDFVEDMAFDRLGAFTFSPEDNTPAAAMKNQIPDEVKEERLNRLMAAQQRISKMRNQLRVGREESILVTGRQGKLYTGRSQMEAPDIDGLVLFSCESALEPGRFVKVRITSAEEYDLRGVCHEPA